MCLQAAALMILQEVGVRGIPYISLFENAILCTMYANWVMMMPHDILLARGELKKLHLIWVLRDSMNMLRTC